MTGSYSLLIRVTQTYINLTKRGCTYVSRVDYSGVKTETETERERKRQRLCLRLKKINEPTISAYPGIG